MLPKHAFILSLIPLCIALAEAQTKENIDTNSKTKIVAHQAPGNLQVHNDVDCVNFEELKTEYSPADLYRAVRKCVVSDQYEKSVQIFILAGAYSRFDKKRVADQSAHQATTVLLMHALDGISEEKKTKFQATFKEHFVDGGDGSINKEDCDRLRKFGAPTYYPDYMIKHGIETFLPGESKLALVENFDGEKSWNQILNDSLGCPSE